MRRLLQVCVLALLALSCRKEDDPVSGCVENLNQNVPSGAVELYFEVEWITLDQEFYVRLEIPKTSTIIQVPKSQFLSKASGMYYGWLVYLSQGDVVKAGVYTCDGSKPTGETYQILFNPKSTAFTRGEATLAIGETYTYTVK